MDYKQIFTIKRLWIMFAALMVFMFSALLIIGGRIYQEAPPVPKMVTVNGEAFLSKEDINDGRDVWGHGTYLAPDWTADFLHREAVAILSARTGSDFEQQPEST